MGLNLSANIPDPDGFYDELLGVHQALNKAESDALNARLILVLALSDHLLRINSLHERSIIRPGQRLVIPGYRTKQATVLS